MFDLQNPLVFKPELLTPKGIKAAFSAIRRTCGGSYMEFSENTAYIELPANMRVKFDFVSEYDSNPQFVFWQKRGFPYTGTVPHWSTGAHINRKKSDFDHCSELEFGLNIFCRLNDTYFLLEFDSSTLYEFDEKELILFSFILEAFTGVASNVIYHEMVARRQNAIVYHARKAVNHYQLALEQRQRDIELYNFPVFVHDRDCITREAIALEYLRQSPLTGDIVEQVCTETAQWMQRLYTERAFSPLPDSVGTFIERLVAHPNREAEPLMLARKAADWLEQAAREYEIAFARQPRTPR